MAPPKLTFPHKTKLVKPRGIDIFNAQQKYIAKTKSMEEQLLADIKACERKANPKKIPADPSTLTKEERDQLEAELARQKKEEEEADEEAEWEKQLLEKNIKQRLAWCAEHNAWYITSPGAQVKWKLTKTVILQHKLWWRE